MSRFLNLAALLTVAALGGCTQQNANLPLLPPGQPTADTNTTPTHSKAAPLGKGTRPSGYLSSYDDLTVLKPGVQSYKSERLGEFSRFIVDPVAVLPERTLAGVAIDELTRQRLATDLQAEVRDTLRLAGKLSPTNAAGPGVARLRAAVTEVARTLKPNRTREGQLGGATVEAEVLDSETGERLGTVIVSEVSAESDESSSGSDDLYSDVRIVFRSWAARMNKWLEPVE